jgi:hypothetical protein
LELQQDCLHAIGGAPSDRGSGAFVLFTGRKVGRKVAQDVQANAALENKKKKDEKKKEHEEEEVKKKKKEEEEATRSNIVNLSKPLLAKHTLSTCGCGSGVSIVPDGALLG